MAHMRNTLDSAFFNFGGGGQLHLRRVSRLRYSSACSPAPLVNRRLRITLSDSPLLSGQQWGQPFHGVLPGSEIEQSCPLGVVRKTGLQV